MADYLSELQEVDDVIRMMEDGDPDRVPEDNRALFSTAPAIANGRHLPGTVASFGTDDRVSPFDIANATPEIFAEAHRRLTHQGDSAEARIERTHEYFEIVSQLVQESVGARTIRPSGVKSSGVPVSEPPSGRSQPVNQTAGSDAPRSVYEENQMSLEELLQVPDLGEKPAKPAFRVQFELPIGKHVAPYHWVLTEKNFAILVFDTRFDLLEAYEPPASDEPIRMSLLNTAPAQTMLVTPTGVVYNFGVFRHILLVVHEILQVGDAHAEAR